MLGAAIVSRCPTCQKLVTTLHTQNSTLRKEDGDVPQAALLWNPQGSRKRGRPKTSWRRLVTKEVGRSWNELRFLAADRQKWKDLIDNLCS